MHPVYMHASLETKRKLTHSSCAIIRTCYLFVPEYTVCVGHSKACSKEMLCICDLAADPAAWVEYDMGPTKLIATALSWTESCQAGILIMSTTADACLCCRCFNQNSLTAAIGLQLALTSSDGGRTLEALLSRNYCSPDWQR